MDREKELVWNDKAWYPLAQIQLDEITVPVTHSSGKQMLKFI
jgi:hypothetical protein